MSKDTIRRLLEISIHAPREGRDYGSDLIRKLATIFQSTRPARGATIGMRDCRFFDGISIHAPREGRDRDPNTQQENH